MALESSTPSDSASQLLLPVRLAWSDVSYTVKGKRIVQGLNGVVNPGEVLSVMGPSGSGKTTLVDILSGRFKKGTLSGTVTYNGESKAQVGPYFEQVVGYVTQEDVLKETMTVRESLMFAAKMRLPSVISVAHRHAIVNRVLRELNLRKIADSRIGGWRHRGISGGERKRVSIGMELVANPSLLFLDEPTTGLSATDALQIMAVVRRIAQEGMTVVCSIHQPRSQLYSMFDRLLLLSNGAPVYFGPAQEAVPFFESCGLTCPPGFNVADFLLDNITITSTHPSPPAVAGQGGTANVSFGLSMVGMEPNPDNLLGGHDLPASDAESIGGKSEAEEFEDEGFDLEKWQVPEEQVRMLLMKWEGSEQCRHVEATARNAHSRALKTVTTVDDSGFQRRDSVGSTLQQLPFLTEECPRRGMQKRRVAASCWKQFAALVGRNCVSLKREPWIPVALVVQCCIFGVIVGSLWSSLTRSVAEGQLKALFFLPTFLAISTFLSASRYIKEQQMFMRERASGYYTTLPYMAAKLLIDVPEISLMALGCTSISYYMIGLRSDAEYFLYYLVCTVLFTNVHASLIGLISVVLPNIQGALGTYAILNGFFCLFCGFFVYKTNMPSFWDWAYFMSPNTYAVAGLALNQYADTPDHYFLDLLGIPAWHGQDKWQCFGILLGFYSVLLTATYVSLRFFSKERR